MNEISRRFRDAAMGRERIPSSSSKIGNTVIGLTAYHLDNRNIMLEPVALTVVA